MSTHTMTTAVDAAMLDRLAVLLADVGAGATAGLALHGLHGGVTVDVSLRAPDNDLAAVTVWAARLDLPAPELSDGVCGSDLGRRPWRPFRAHRAVDGLAVDVWCLADFGEPVPATPGQLRVNDQIALGARPDGPGGEPPLWRTVLEVAAGPTPGAVDVKLEGLPGWVTLGRGQKVLARTVHVDGGR